MRAVKVGVIGGSGSDELPELHQAQRRSVDTAYGMVELTEGTLAGVRVAQVSRHGVGHTRLSHQVSHHANLAALITTNVSCVVGLTVCGAVDPDLPPGSVVVFDDVYFPSNRLPDGRLCTWFTEPGQPDRGHWIFDEPFSAPLREVLTSAAASVGIPVVTAGCYGHVDGPRFNSRSEIAALRAVGVTAVSQTAGPEAVLAGEAELPYALLGFVTDYANGVAAQAEPVEALLARIADSAAVFAAVLEKAMPTVGSLRPAGIVHRFGG